MTYLPGADTELTTVGANFWAQEARQHFSSTPWRVFLAPPGALLWEC